MKYDSDPRLLLFDLGGVLMELNDPLKTFELDWELAEFHHRWLLSPAVREFECGAIGAKQFADNVTREMELPYDGAAFTEKFMAWPGPPFAEAVKLIERINKKLDCAILSNTNALHWENLDIQDAFSHRFDRYFLSYETGLLKPDDQAFTHVADAYGCSPEQILFFDDNPLNAAAAENLGMHSVLCRSVDDIATTLRSLDVLNEPQGGN